MSNYYYIEPEVAGRATKNSDESEKYPYIEYVFEGWQGDDLVESYPYFIISEKLKEKIIENDLTGFDIGEVYVSKSDTFQQIYGDRSLPEFYWLKVHGEAASEDFGVDEGILVISETVLSLLNDVNFENYASIRPF